MVSEQAILECNMHRAACQAVAVNSQFPECQVLARALVDANKWLDANFKDLASVYERLESIERQLADMESKMRGLKQAVDRLKG